MLNKYLLTIGLVFLALLSKAQYNSIVSKDGSGNYNTVQAAIDAAPTNSSTPYVIYIAKGRYYEKVTVPSNKPKIQLIGESAASVVIYYDDYAGKPIAGGGTLGTQNSASFIINGADFVAMNITFENSFKYDSAVSAGVSGTQAVAVLVNADRCAFKNCRFIGMQDTLYTKGSGAPRHYFYKCYIDGIVDFIFGSSIAIFDSTIVYAKSRTTTGNSYITAANTTTGQSYGYWFKDCAIPPNTGNTVYFLGRPWNNATAGVSAQNKTVFTNAKMGSSINPLGWSTWDAGTNTNVITYAEYKSKKFDGSLVDVSNRVAWSKQFTNADTVGYNVLNVFNGWDPCTVRNDFCNNFLTELAVSNFKSTKVGTNSNLSWNASYLLSGVTYNVYRSIDNKQSYQLLYTTTSATDSNINFSTQDAYPPNCTKYYYVVEAVKGGYVTTKTDTLEISNTPALTTTTNSISGLQQDINGPGVAQSFSLSAQNLISNVIIKPSVNFEVSLDNSTWVNSTSSLNIAPSGGAISNTLVYVRLNGTIPSTFTGTITISTNCNADIISKEIATSGTYSSTAIVYYDVIQQWNLTTDNLDDATVRISELQPTTPELVKFNLSNQTTIPKAYSAIYGQAIAPNPIGTWSTGAGGPGGNLNRTFYEEFTIKPNANQQVRVDSIVLNAAFYNSSSNTKMAVVWSKSNFTADSNNVSGGRDLSGTTLAATANGAFATPILLLNQTSGTTALYGLALNGSNGVQLNGGDSLKIRLYFSCGTTNTGRYAMLKNVQVKGTTPRLLPVTFKNFDVTLLNQSKVVNNWSVENENNISYYNIQKSTNGNEFSNIGKIASGKKEYSFTDFNYTASSVIYYRIEAVENTNSKIYSTIQSVRFNSNTTGIKIYPNPSKSNVTIECNDIREIVITDYLGRRIIDEKLISNKSILKYSLHKGVYYVAFISQNKERKVEKIIIE